MGTEESIYVSVQFQTFLRNELNGSNLSKTCTSGKRRQMLALELVEIKMTTFHFTSRPI